MRLFHSIIFVLFSICNLYAIDTPLNEIKDSLRVFITKTEVLSDSFYVKNDLSDDLIRDVRLNKGIEEKMNGIFLFNVLSHHQNLHFVLIDDTGFEIINMREPFENNLSKLVIFLKRNDKYTKDDIFFYVSDFMRVYDYNKKVNSKKGPIL